MRKKKYLIFLYAIVFFVFIISLLIMVPTTVTSKRKVYNYTYGQLRPLLSLRIPNKYKSLWNDILSAHKKNYQKEKIIKILKDRHKINGDQLGSILKKMGLSSKPKEYVKALILGQNPILEIVLKGTGVPPKGTPQYDAAIYGVIPYISRVMEKYTDKIRFKVAYYPGGILGDEPDFIRKIKHGEIQWAGGTAIMGQMVAPEISVLDLPFLFDFEPKIYWDDLKYCGVDWMLGKASHSISKFFHREGYILVGLLDGGGWFQIASKDFPVKTLKDINKLSYMMLAGSRIAPEIKAATGYRKIIVGQIWDTPANSATGIIDSVMCGWFWHVILQLTPYYKYVTDYPIDGYSAAVAIADKRMFNSLIEVVSLFGPMLKLSKKDALSIAKRILLTMNKKIKENMRKPLRRCDAKARYSLLNSGIYKLVHFHKRELKKLKEKILPLYEELADKKGTYPKWFLDDMLRYREEYRKYKHSGRLTNKWWKKGIYPDGFDEWEWIKKIDKNYFK